jgi:hypothetical protein
MTLTHGFLLYSCDQFIASIFSRQQELLPESVTSIPNQFNSAAMDVAIANSTLIPGAPMY